MDILDWLTLATAVWGSITGTVAIILLVRDSLKDRPSILVRPHFEYSNGFDLRPKISLIVELTNAGHRPTTLDSIHAVYRPAQWWKVPIWIVKRKGRRWLSNPWDRKYHRVLEEGRHCKFHFGQETIGPKSQFDPVNLRRIIVRDKAGREWSSSAQFGQDRIREYREAENLQKDDLAKDDRRFEIRLHRISGEQQLRARYLLEKQYRYYRESYENLENAKESYFDLLEKGKEFIEGKIDMPFEHGDA